MQILCFIVRHVRKKKLMADIGYSPFRGVEGHATTASLLNTFRHMSASRDAQVKNIDRDRSTSSLQYTPRAHTTRSPIRPTYTEGGDSTGSLRRISDHERTIYIGHAPISRSVSPRDGTTTTDWQHGPIQPPLMHYSAISPLQSSYLPSQPLVAIQARAPPQQWQAGQYDFTAHTTLSHQASRSPGTVRWANNETQHIQIGSISPGHRSPTGVAEGADDDAFDRGAVVGRSLASHVASPRVFSPDVENADYSLPQPDVLIGDVPGGAYASLRDDFLRGAATKHRRHNGHNDDTSGNVASPPPRAPDAHHRDDRSSSQSEPQTNGRLTPMIHRQPSSNSLADSAAHASDATQHAVNNNRVPSQALMRSGSSMMDFNGIPIPVPIALGGPITNFENTSTLTQQRPSKFLSAIVEAIALRKQATVLPTISAALVHAFDSIVRDGAYFVKYTTTSAPHERFFQIRFVDVQGNIPEPCLSWAVHRTSWSSKGVLNLASVTRVVRGASTRAFQRQQIDNQRIRGPMVGGPHRAVLPLSHAFYLETLSGALRDGSNEPLSLLSLNAEVFEAWTLFLDFVTSIGAPDMSELR